MSRTESTGGRREKRPLRGRRRWRIGFLAAACLALAISAAVLFVSRSGEPSTPRAAIVDQLSLTAPNPSFAEEVTRTLEEAGYAVDYYPGEGATVDFYHDLPTHGYGLIVFRNHSARRPDVLRERLPDEAALFTSEAYDRDKYVEDQDALRLVKVSYQDSSEVFFGVRSDFITDSMSGRFDGAASVLMGCNGLTTSRTAEAFVEKGATAVVGWSDLVSAGHTDRATEILLRHLIANGETIGEAAESATVEVGPDPAYGSVLRVYPPEATILSSR